VMIEAMACGTPVLAFRCGSVPEIVDDGVSGVIVDDMDQAVAATDRLLAMDRRRCRGAFDSRFSVARMARDYAAAYKKVIWATGEQQSAAAS
jgi:glycosyltransferase involved in cell wall biosynthesis